MACRGDEYIYACAHGRACLYNIAIDDYLSNSDDITMNHEDYDVDVDDDIIDLDTASGYMAMSYNEVTGISLSNRTK